MNSLPDSQVEGRDERVRPPEASVTILIRESYGKVGWFLVMAGEQQSPHLCQVASHRDGLQGRRHRQEQPLMAEGNHFVGRVAEDQGPDAAVSADE